MNALLDTRKTEIQRETERDRQSKRKRQRKRETETRVPLHESLPAMPPVQTMWSKLMYCLPYEYGFAAMHASFPTASHGTHTHTHTHTQIHTHTYIHTHVRVTAGQIRVGVYTLLQHTATHTASICITMQHTATHCITLQHAASHCNTLHALGFAST